MTESQDAMTSERRRRPFRGLSVKLLVLTIVFVMVAEVTIFVPSVANYRLTWLRDRLATANVAALLLEHEGNDLSLNEDMRTELLKAIGAEAVAVRSEGMRRLLAMSEMPAMIARDVDLRDARPLTAIADAFETLVVGGERTIRVIGAPPRGGEFLEVILSETPLRQAMMRYSRNILVLSLVISLVTAALVFFSLNGLFVRPMRRLTGAMARFSEAPEDPSRIIVPSRRDDEVGLAEERLAAMQRQLAGTLKQQRRLADVGLAVSKINHDLRNLLASAQLFSDRLTALPDPTVQRFAPKLIGALDRAIAYCQSTLTYGRAEEQPPVRRLLALDRLVEDVAEVLTLREHPTIAFENQVPEGLEIEADPEQLFRVLVNLCRNAVQAMEGEDDPAIIRRLAIAAGRESRGVRIEVTDTGPGVPKKARENLFRAFEGSARPGGTGLGLAIAAELVRAHGGTLALKDGTPGATFVILLTQEAGTAAEP
ncbi:MAG: HAMP domain-containing sensor histidine kinase [Hyphomicrobiales bacterium]